MATQANEPDKQNRVAYHVEKMQMNKQLAEFARSTIKDGLRQLPDKSVVIFKRMYAKGNMSLDIETVVDQMPDEKLDWAMQQIENTLRTGIRKC